MKEEKKYKVSIYCKIYTENYPFLDGEFTGDEIFNHLISNCNCIPESGDKNIWYLCINEKHGHLFIETNNFPYEWVWGFGDSSYKYVKQFIDRLFLEKIISKNQYDILFKEIKIARNIGDMYEIGNYLNTIKNNKQWIPKITNTRTEAKRFLDLVKESFQEKGYEFR